MTAAAPVATGRRDVGAVRALGVGAAAGAVAAASNLAVSALARGPLGASDDFVPLTAGPVVLWTVVGAVVGAVGWRLVVTRSARARAVLAVLVPAVLVLSLVPDVALLVTGSTPGQTTTAVVALMVMHVLTAAVVVTAYRRAMPPG
ncbi:MAG: hypothetical protein HY830_04810 [Actinobacteria bacterium]|nr:hypothetical protein [Actinomycetota bacterium]